MKIEIKEITTIEELEQMQRIEEVVWQETPIPLHQTLTALRNGGVIIGAFLKGEMIGFQYSFPGFDGNEIYLVSHSLAILPAYRKSGIGEKIKRKQRDVAAHKGYDKMIWTFDPLHSVNAFLNLHKLGAIATTYKENYYGMMDDGLNKGLASDRFVVEWKCKQEQEALAVSFDPSKVLVEMDQNKEPIRTNVIFQNESDKWFIAIPKNIQEIKEENLELAIKWRTMTRELFQLLFSNGYKGRYVIRDENVSYYCFVK
ncbi:GNAT family N-acetyltransferase [Ornithinibacillus sp. 179-J 7C1 HS]|uniref:GNAT family N-acetyltransferase n=1 Tax=Ornithinibacillus sp. 179-J 7C1 HS TaxID=3142384 RepID=UPI00399FD246